VSWRTNTVSDRVLADLDRAISDESDLDLPPVLRPSRSHAEIVAMLEEETARVIAAETAQAVKGAA
jgi:hypothetical protein